MNWVVPSIINEYVILNLPQEVMAGLTTVCTDIIISYINKYCEQYAGSTDEDTIKCVKRLNDSFEYINAKNKYLRSRDAKNIVDTLSGLSYVDISYDNSDTAIQTYKEYKICIETALNGIGNLGKARVVGKDDLESFLLLCEKYKVLHPEATPIELNAVETLRKIVKNNKSLFKSAPFRTNTNTIFTRLVSQKERLETLLYGVNFLLSKIEQGARPESWRYL